MKKLVMTIAVLACAASVATAQTVTSANVVGYTKSTLEPGFNMVRMPFVEGGQAATDIQLIFDTSVLTQGGDLGSADSIQFWDMVAIKYDRYFLHDGSGKTGAGKGGKWVDNDTQEIATNVVPPEQGFFFVRSGSSVEVITSGEVVAAQTGTNSVTLLEGFNLVANPFTAEWKLNDGSTDWIAQGAVAGADLGSADSIQFWDIGGLKYDRYFLHDGSGKTGAGKGGKWVDNDTQSVDANLAVGISEGIFYSRVIGAGNVTIEIEQPYDL